MSDTEHIAKSSCVDGKAFSTSKSDSAVATMKESLYKNTQEYVTKNHPNDKIDVLLVCTMAIINDSDTQKEIKKYLETKTKLGAQGITNEVLIALFCDIDTKHLFGGGGEGFPKRLDKITKPEKSSEDGSSVAGSVPFLDWNSVNSWSWKDIIEPLAINMTKGDYTPTLPSSLERFAKIIYLYYELNQKTSSSSLDNANLGFSFPFTNEQLSSIYLSSPYGMRSSGMHYGVDLAAGVNTPIHSIGDGVVFAVNPTNNQAAGIFVMIKHNCSASPTGYIISCYYHLNKHAVSEGQSVTKGQVVGYMGYTGHCEPAGVDGTHLHFQINENNGSGSDGVDPAKYFPLFSNIRANGTPLSRQISSAS